MITGTGTPDQVDDCRTGTGRARAGGIVRASARTRSKREVDEDGQRPLRELLRLSPLKRQARVLHQLPVVLDRRVRRPQCHRRRNQAFRLVDLSEAKFDDAQHVQGVVGVGRGGDDAAVLARGLVDTACHLHRERLLHALSEEVACHLVEMFIFATRCTIGRSRWSSGPGGRSTERAVAILVAAPAATRARAVARGRRDDQSAHTMGLTSSAAGSA
jgi:hypothetical protein